MKEVKEGDGGERKVTKKGEYERKVQNRRVEKMEKTGEQKVGGSR